MAPVVVCSKQPLEEAPLKSSAPKPLVPPFIGVLLQMGMAWEQSWDTCPCAVCQNSKNNKVLKIGFHIKDCRFGHYKSTARLALTIIYVVKPQIPDVKSFINVYLCPPQVVPMKLEQALEEQYEERGNDHVGSSSDTPLREDAFVLSDEEKIERIQH